MKKVRVFLGPCHTAGMLWEYRQGLRSIGVDAKVVICRGHPFQYPYDIGLPFIRNRGLDILQYILFSLVFLPKLIHDFDIFHFTYRLSILPFNLDVYLLKLCEKKIVMHFVGDDVRPGPNAYENEKKKKKIQFWEKYADAIISFPEYSQLQTKEYYIIPLGYDLDYWKPFTSTRVKKGDSIMIVHAPSDQEKKGTAYVKEAVELLMSEGYNIEFKLLENLSNSEVREWINISDIVIDQLLVGWYGVFAIESMALAKPTVCFIDEKYRRKVEYGKIIPLVSATPQTLYNTLKMLIENPDLRSDIGEKSRKYVEEVHDSKKAAQQLLQLYQRLTKE